MSSTTSTAVPRTLSQRTRLAIMGAVMLGLFLSALDQTVVGTALPTIVTDLGGNSVYVWVVTAYLLTSTVTVPMWGKLSDLFGRRPILLIGIGIFLAGSALSGLSQNMAELITFRGLQGIGAGSMFPVALAVIGDIFSPRERGRYQGLFGAVFGLSFLVGPFLGGWITDSIGWHWVFYVNLPIGLVALAVIAVTLPNMRREGARGSLDIWGAVVFTVAIVSLLIGLTEKGLTNAQGQAYGWFDWRVGGLILLAGLILAVFVVIEARAAEPIIPLGLFRNLNFSLVQLATFFLAFGFFGAVIFMPRYFQAVRGISATASGYMIWPLLVGLIATSVLSGQLVSRTGRYRRLLIVAAVVMAVGMLLLTRLTATTSDPALWLWLFIAGVGIGPSMSVYTVVVQATVSQRNMGVATSTLVFIRQVASTVGLAIAGTLVGSTFTSQLPLHLARAGVPAAAVRRLALSGTGGLTGIGTSATASVTRTLPPALRALVPHIVRAIHATLAEALASTFWLGVIGAAAALAAVMVLREVRLRTTTGVGGPAAEPVTGPAIGPATGLPAPEPAESAPAARVAAGDTGTPGR